jgi:GT2 family glycosyltransferase
MPKLFIVISVFNRKTITLKCLEQLSNQSVTNFSIVVVDDGSTDGTSDDISNSYPDVTIINGTGDWWWTRSTNEGIRHALRNGASHVLCLNDDTFFDDKYVEEIVYYIGKYPTFVIGSLNVTDETPPRVYFSGAYGLNKLLFRFKRYEPTLSSDFNFIGNSELIRSIYLPGRGLIIPCSVFSQVGFLDDVCFPQYGSDVDFTLRVNNHNRNVYLATKLVLRTSLSTTGSGDFYLFESPILFYKSFFNRYSKRYYKVSLHLIKRNVPRILVPFTFCVYMCSIVAKYILLRLKLKL